MSTPHAEAARRYALERLRDLSEAADVANVAWSNGVREARELGCSLREVAGAAGVSNVTVLRMTRGGGWEMSATAIRYLHCDGCGEAYTADAAPGDTVRSFRQDARKEGWRVSLPGGRDYCPNCRDRTAR